MATPKTPPPGLGISFLPDSHLAQNLRPLRRIPTYDVAESHEFAPSPTSVESLERNLDSPPTGQDTMLVALPSQAWFPALHITFAALPWESMIASASTQNEIILLLGESAFKHIADRLRYLQHLGKNDPEEPSMLIDSMRALVGFLTTERLLPDPEIGISPNGLAQIEWRIPPSGIIALEFLTSGLIRFAAISPSAQCNDTRLRVNGTLHKPAVLDAIRSFSSPPDHPQDEIRSS